MSTFLYEVWWWVRTWAFFYLVVLYSGELFGFWNIAVTWR